MALQHLSVEVQVRLTEFAWEASKVVGRGGDTGSMAVKKLVDNFTQALDGFVRACETAGKGEKAQ